ncbi:MAG: hypothetical protein QXR84_01535 [Candidatus Bathyarchaeia archaeon]
MRAFLDIMRPKILKLIRQKTTYAPVVYTHSMSLQDNSNKKLSGDILDS